MRQDSRAGKPLPLQPNWIADQPALHRLAADLRELPRIAVDTESNSLFAYREQVCLLQISSPREDFLIDTLELDDLACLKPLFASSRIEKVVHAAEYDILCLKRDYGIMFAAVFDTMQAARILGMREVGLGAILEKEFGVTQDKRYQRANWGQRPLPQAQLVYACGDTSHLIPLRERLSDRLNERGLQGLAAEDFARVCKVEPNGSEERALCWKISGAMQMTPRERAILNELCVLREDLAEKANRPPFKVLANESLAALAKENPRRREDLTDISGLSPRLIDRYGEEILEALERGRSAAPIQKPARPPRPPEEFLLRLERLKQWRKEAGKKMEVESDIILPRDILEEIALRNPQDFSSLKQIMAEVPWRLEHFGDQILRITQNNQERT